ncbi:MAG TPA: hypothetical protein VFJ51_06805 [Nitrososphaeraceae archaeon]|nr:hypothetical protein [Nitrososphaeraceae archaeon]
MVDIDFSVQVLYNGSTLYEFDASDSTLTLTASSDLKNHTIEVVDKSGIYNLEVEFNPIPTYEFKTNNGIISLSNGNTFYTKNRTYNDDFGPWFSSLCLLLGEKIHLIPDTNFFQRRYYTNYIKNIHALNGNKDKLFLKIPRLEIIEVENKFNRNKVSQKETEDKKKQKEMEVRRAFHTMAEILSMKKDGAEILSNVDLSMLQSFTPLSGQGFADTWIRREISNNMSSLQWQNVVRRDEIERSNAIFLTCDLMNALAANAENLNTFYFHRLDEDKVKLGFEAYGKLASLIINTAILFGECDSVIKSQTREENIKYKGAWNGKHPSEWQNNIIIYKRAVQISYNMQRRMMAGRSEI